ncbi:TPA: hypothetical protein ACHKYT_004636, partial [Escherichia coli]
QIRKYSPPLPVKTNECRELSFPMFTSFMNYIPKINSIHTDNNSSQLILVRLEYALSQRDMLNIF